MSSTPAPNTLPSYISWSMTGCSAFDFIVYTLYKHYKWTKIDDDVDGVSHVWFII